MSGIDMPDQYTGTINKIPNGCLAETLANITKAYAATSQDDHEDYIGLPCPDEFNSVEIAKKPEEDELACLAVHQSPIVIAELCIDGMHTTLRHNLTFSFKRTGRVIAQVWKALDITEASDNSHYDSKELWWWDEVYETEESLPSEYGEMIEQSLGKIELAGLIPIPPKPIEWTAPS